MAKFTDYTQKTKPADADLLLIHDNAGAANKKTPFSGVWSWILDKLASAVISQLETKNKSIIPAINELNSKTAGLNISNGTGVTAYYNSSILILNFTAQKISCDNDSVVESIILPKNVRPTSDRYVMIPILSAGWVPTNQIAFLIFSPGNAKPTLRVSNNVESVSNIILIGSYVFPEGFFMVT